MSKNVPGYIRIKNILKKKKIRSRLTTSYCGTQKPISDVVVIIICRARRIVMRRAAAAAAAEVDLGHGQLQRDPKEKERE